MDVPQANCDRSYDTCSKIVLEKMRLCHFASKGEIFQSCDAKEKKKFLFTYEISGIYRK